MVSRLMQRMPSSQRQWRWYHRSMWLPVLTLGLLLLHRTDFFRAEEIRATTTSRDRQHQQSVTYFTSLSAPDYHQRPRQEDAYTQDYTSPLEEYPPPSFPHNRTNSTNNHWSSRLPPPLEIIEQYKKWHSQEALERDPHHRKFIVAHYQCPTSAGNWMHYFTSAFMWGILTNRTILWRYVTNDVCHSIRLRWQYRFNAQRCNVSASDPAVCHGIVSRAPWIPSYDEWMHRLALSEEHDVYMVPLEHSGKRRQVEDPIVSPLRPVDTYYAQFPVIDIHPWAFLRLDHLIYKPELRRQQLGTAYAHVTLKQLAVWGAPSLFGLLWRYSFDYVPAIRQHVSQHPSLRQRFLEHESLAQSQDTRVSIPRISNSSIRSRRESNLTIAVHSRHIESEDDGCDTHAEQACLVELMTEYRRQTRTPATTPVPCRVTLASDRTCTIDRLAEWLNETLQCRVVVLSEHLSGNHANGTVAVFQEHGPFSGSGFFQDMLLAGLTVRDAMVGSLEPLDGRRWRSSSELIEESITYHRDMSSWSEGRDPAILPDLVECTLRRKASSRATVRKAAPTSPRTSALVSVSMARKQSAR